MRELHILRDLVRERIEFITEAEARVLMGVLRKQAKEIMEAE